MILKSQPWKLRFCKALLGKPQKADFKITDFEIGSVIFTSGGF
jgi:hypothetical protein